MADKQQAREQIQRLVNKFEGLNKQRKKSYNEADTRKDFVLPLFKALGWDIKNKDRKPPHERNVIVELAP